MSTQILKDIIFNQKKIFDFQILMENILKISEEILEDIIFLL